MIKTIIRKGSYQDSVVLMLLTNKVSSMTGVTKASIMMATPANKEMFQRNGLATDELMEASANDMAVVIEIDSEEIIHKVELEMDHFLKSQEADESQEEKEKPVKNWDQALEKAKEANLALISIPGIYAAAEAFRALEANLNVFIFSDNVSLKDEVLLKKKAHEKGLLVMGPDCGTGIFNGVPIAFANRIKTGGIGIIGASGTGIQELTAVIAHHSEGITNAIGTGGRDLSNEVKGITMLDAIDAMEADENTKVLVVISKHPARKVRDKIMKRLAGMSKPVVTLFQGENPKEHEENFYHAYTLEEAGCIAVSLLRGEPVSYRSSPIKLKNKFKQSDKKTIKGFYSGGSLAGEAAMLIKDTLDIYSEKNMHCFDEHTIIDLGDDIYTKGKPHPMIDPEKRIECLQEAACDSSTGVILFDIVLGYGSHPNMAKALLPCIRSVNEKKKREDKEIYFVAVLCGTDDDPQNYGKQKEILEAEGVFVCNSNKKAVMAALELIGYPFVEKEKIVRPGKYELSQEKREVSDSVKALLNRKPNVLNIGLRGFAKVFSQYSCEVTQFDWTPPANGVIELINALNFLRSYHFNNQ